MTIFDYDAAADAAPITIQVAGAVYEYGSEAPLAMAIEWIDLNTNPARGKNLTRVEMMETNYRLIFGEANYVDMLDREVGSKTIDNIYLDMLEAWGFYTDPNRKRRSIRAILNELTAALKDADEVDLVEAANEMADMVTAKIKGDDDAEDTDPGE